MKVEAFHSEEAFNALQGEWNGLLYNSPRNHIFLTWQWQSNWWAAYHPGELWIITARDEDNTLVGLFPWFIQNHAKGRMVRSVGCVEVTDYLEPILKGGYEEAALQAVAKYLKTEKDRYDMIDLCNIPADSPILKLFPTAMESAGYSVEIKQQEVCPVIRLPENWEDYLSTLDKKQRHELRRKLRRIDNRDHVVEWKMVNPKEDLQQAMDRFLALMRASHPDKAKFLEDPENVDFFHRIVPAIANCGWLALSFLQIDGQDAAAYFSFDYNNHILLYNSGHNPGVYSDLSPGIVLLTYIIQDAIEKKREVFDFLRGDEEYKYRMGAVDTPVMMLNAKLN